MYIHTHTYTHIHTNMYTYICMHKHVYAHTYTHINKYIQTYAYIHICTYSYKQTYINTCIYVHTPMSYYVCTYLCTEHYHPLIVGTIFQIAGPDSSEDPRDGLPRYCWESWPQTTAAVFNYKNHIFCRVCMGSMFGRFRRISRCGSASIIRGRG